MAKGRRLNIYMDSHSVLPWPMFMEAIYEEWGLLTAKKKTIKTKQEILNLLAASWYQSNWPSSTAIDIKRLTPVSGEIGELIFF